MLSFEIAGALRRFHHGCGAGERLLAVGGHDRAFGAATDGGIATTAAMLGDDARTALGIGPWFPFDRLDNGFDDAVVEDGEQAETEQAAELLDFGSASRPRPRLEALTASQTSSQTAVRSTACEHEFESEAHFQFADHDGCGLAFVEGDDIAAANLAFDLEA